MWGEREHIGASFGVGAEIGGVYMINVIAKYGPLRREAPFIARSASEPPAGPSFPACVERWMKLVLNNWP